MATNKAVRADDVSGLNIATVSFTEDAVTKHAQQVSVVDATTPTQKLAIDASGRPTVNVNGTVVTTTTALIKDSGAVELFTASNPGRVDVTGATVQPVSGTFWQATQPVSGTFFQAKQPVSAASGDLADGSLVTLGAKTDAKSTATDATSITAMQVLKQISASVQAPPSQAVTNAGTFAVQSTGQSNSGVDIGDVTINNAAGASAVNVQDGGNSLTVDGTVAATQSGTWTVQPGNTANTTAWKVDGSAVTQPVSGTVSITSNSAVNVAQINGVAATMGNGASGTGVLRVTLANDSTGVVQNIAGTTGGASIYHAVSAASTNAANVKASAGTLYGWSILNTNAAARYVKLHNTAGTPTAGASVVYTIGVPASGGSNIDLNVGLAFGTGIGISMVTGSADSDATGVASGDLVVNLHYK